MSSAAVSDRGLRRKLNQDAVSKVQPTQNGQRSTNNNNRKSSSKSKSNVHKSIATPSSAEQNNNIKRPKLSCNSKENMLAAYQPWVIQTYGDLAKTKTITIKKYARILRTLRGEETVSADNSKFRFWVKAKGFHVGKPPGYDAKPADAIVGRFSVCDTDEGISAVDDKLQGSAKDPPLYVPNAPSKNSTTETTFRKVAVVENFFDIIYNVHVELEGRPGKHAGQKRTYRTITETYAFLPREAVTRFLLGCTDCQRHPRSPSPSPMLSTASPSPTLPLISAPLPVLPMTTSNQSNNTISSKNECNSATLSASSSKQQIQNNVDFFESTRTSCNNLLQSLPENDLSSSSLTPINGEKSVSPFNNHPSPGSHQGGFAFRPSQNLLKPPHSPIPISCKSNFNSLPTYPNQFLASSPPSHYVDFTKPTNCNGSTFGVTNTSSVSSPSPTLDLSQRTTVDITQSQANIDVPLAASTPEPRRSSNPLDVCNLTAKDPPRSPKKLHPDNLSEHAAAVVSSPSAPKLWSPVHGLNVSNESRGKRSFIPAEIDFSMPITTTYLKYMRSLGCPDDEAFKFENKDVLACEASEKKSSETETEMT